jgi:hypothetical protein
VYRGEGQATIVLRRCKLVRQSGAQDLVFLDAEL